jgi:outer membrane protein assembly factor BamB
MKSLSLLVLAALSPLATAADWPTYRLNNFRSGDTTESIKLPLKQAWTVTNQAPEQAWTGPAKWDAYAGNDGLQSMRNFDPCYFVTTAGDKAYFSSSADHAVHCINQKTGNEVWTFFTDAAVRFPPTIVDNLAVFGSDDGYVYAVDSTACTLVWMYLAGPKDHRIPSNGKFISMWPVRTAVLVQDGVAYFGASLAPWEKSYLKGIDLTTGKASSKGFSKEWTDMTFQGALLANKDRLYVPQGRTSPLVFNISNGEQVGKVGQAGGTFALIDQSGNFFAGPENQRSRDEQMRAFNTDNTRVATFNNANRLVVSGDTAYIHTNRELKAFDMKKNNALASKLLPLEAQARKTQQQINAKPANVDELKTKKKELDQQIAKLKQEQATCWLWNRSSRLPLDLIATPKTIIAGYPGEVEIISKEDGKVLWNTEIEGTAHGLTYSNGTLYVSTNLGTIHAFTH